MRLGRSQAVDNQQGQRVTLDQVQHDGKYVLQVGRMHDQQPVQIDATAVHVIGVKRMAGIDPRGQDIRIQAVRCRDGFGGYRQLAGSRGTGNLRDTPLGQPAVESCIQLSERSCNACDGRCLLIGAGAADRARSMRQLQPGDHCIQSTMALRCHKPDLNRCSDIIAKLLERQKIGNAQRTTVRSVGGDQGDCVALWGAVDVPSQGESLLDMHFLLVYDDGRR